MYNKIIKTKNEPADTHKYIVKVSKLNIGSNFEQKKPCREFAIRI